MDFQRSWTGEREVAFRDRDLEPGIATAGADKIRAANVTAAAAQIYGCGLTRPAVVRAT